MSFRVGEKVLLKAKASAESILLWKGYSQKYPYLIGPCNIPTTQVLVIKCIVGKTGLLVQYLDNELKLSMVRAKDVKRVV